MKDRQGLNIKNLKIPKERTKEKLNHTMFMDGIFYTVKIIILAMDYHVINYSKFWLRMIRIYY